MLTFTLLAALALPSLGLAQVITPDTSVPDGYQVGFATVLFPSLLASHHATY